MHPAPRPPVHCGYHAGINQPRASFVTSSPTQRIGVYYFAISSNHLPAFFARTVKYAYRDLIPRIPAQIKAVSVQDYNGNSCNAALPQLISHADERQERRVTLCVFSRENFLSARLISVCKPCGRQGIYLFIYLFYPDLTVCCAFITGHAVLVIGVRSRLPAGRGRGVECKWLICNHGLIITPSEPRSSLSRCFRLAMLMVQ